MNVDKNFTSCRVWFGLGVRKPVLVCAPPEEACRVSAHLPVCSFTVLFLCCSDRLAAGKMKVAFSEACNSVSLKVFYIDFF